MKTPREILLEQHQSNAPKLDTIRREVVRKLNNEETKEQSFSDVFVAWLLHCSKTIWRELVFPSRRIWAGLATAWLLIFAVNFSLSDHSPVATTKSSSPEIFMSFRQQERLLAELTGPDDLRVAEPPKKFFPKPRTEIAKLLTA
jgi:hypothetical protein